MATEAQARFDYKVFKKLANTENNPHLRNHYRDKMVAAQAVLRKMQQNDSGEKPPRTPWKRMNVKSDYFEVLR